MEGAGEAEERDDGGELVQDEEGGDVGERSGAEGLDVAAEELGEAGFDAGDAGGRLRCFAGRASKLAEAMSREGTPACEQVSPEYAEHCGRC